jgi:hypothetical protein
MGIMGYFIKYFLDIRFLKYRKPIEAAEEFRKCFLDKLKGFYPLPTGRSYQAIDFDTILRTNFPDLQTAIEKYRSFIPWYLRWAFDRAWLCYYSAYRRKGEQCYQHYIKINSNPNADDNFRNNIAKLLSFAKHS